MYGSHLIVASLQDMACCAISTPFVGIPQSKTIGSATRINRTVPLFPLVTLKAARAETDGKYGIGLNSKKATDARDDLIGLLSAEERGVRTLRNTEKRKAIFEAIDALAAFGADTVTTDDSLSEEWRMLWTTEKETLFILEKAPLLGTRAGDVLQIIDVSRGSLRNVIKFPPTGMFVVNSTVEVASAMRVNFRFTGASLLVGKWNLPIPPFGQGWFETLYLDEKIRVSKDSRGDYLVCGRPSSVLSNVP